MIDPVDVFRARAEARAVLWRAGEYTLHEAVDELQAAAERSGLVAKIGQDAVQAIMAEAFADPPEDFVEESPPRNSCAQSTLDAAAWLWFQVGDRERFNAWISRHSKPEQNAIEEHIKNIKARRHA